MSEGVLCANGKMYTIRADYNGDVLDKLVYAARLRLLDSDLNADKVETTYIRPSDVCMSTEMIRSSNQCQTSFELGMSMQVDAGFQVSSKVGNIDGHIECQIHVEVNGVDATIHDDSDQTDLEFCDFGQSSIIALAKSTELDFDERLDLSSIITAGELLKSMSIDVVSDKFDVSTIFN